MEIWLNLMIPRKCSSILNTRKLRIVFQVNLDKESSKMLRSQFEEDLEKLHNHLCYGTRSSFPKLIAQRFVTHTTDLAKEVEEDAEVNGNEVKPEKKSLKLLRQQMSHKTWCTVLTVLKAVSDLERMGDHAVFTGKQLFVWRANNVSQQLRKIKNMGRCGKSSWKQLELLP